MLHIDIEKTNPALLIIDVQRRFFRTAATQAKLPGLLAGINELTDFFHEKSLPVIHIVTAHEADDAGDPPGEAEEIPGIHCLGTDIFITKAHLSAFVRTGLEDRLWELDVNTVVLAGFSTNACLGLTAIDAYEPDFMPILAGDAILGIDREREADMLRVLEHEYGVVPVSNARIQEILWGRLIS
jgi:nicotinamidase-related amidase